MKLPVYFLLLFLVVFALLTLFSLLYTWGRMFDPEISPPAYLVPATMILSARSVLIVAVLLSVTFLLFRLVGLKGNRIISLVVIGVTALAVQIVGVVVFRELSNALREGATVQSYAVPERQFLSFPEADVYVGESTGIELSPAVVHRSREIPGFSMYAVAVRDPVENELIVPGAAESFPIRDAQEAYVSLFEPTGFLQSAFDDVGVLNDRLTESYAPGSPIFVVTSVALMLVAVSSWCFVRLTRWPLFNGIVALAFLRGIVYLYALLEGDFFRDLAGAVIDASTLSYVAPGFLSAVAVVLFCIALLMPPFEDWKREISDE